MIHVISINWLNHSVVFFLSFFFFFFAGGCCAQSLLLCTGFSLVAASGGFSLMWCVGFSCCWACALGWEGFRSTQAQYLWLAGLVSLRHVGSPRTRDWTHVPFIGRWILIHCATREALHHSCLDFFLRSWHKTCVHLKWNKTKSGFINRKWISQNVKVPSSVGRRN